METVKLNNGVEMPILGYGVYQVTPQECERCVKDALETGYRLIDTAQSYHNEAEVGHAIKTSGVKREDIFLVTKIWIANAGDEKAEKSIDESLKKLQTDYVDLLLIHQPFGDYYGTYRAMEKAYKAGKARRQGVGDTISYEERMKTLDEIGRQRTREFRGEKRKDIRALPVKVDESTPQYAREFIEYYENPERGLHPNSDGWYSYTSLAPMMNFFPFVQIETISPRPVLFIAGENAVSKYFSEDAYSKAAEPKELFVIKDATHVDLYDVPKYMDQVLVKLDSYFKKYLN